MDGIQVRENQQTKKKLQKWNEIPVNLRVRLNMFSFMFFFMAFFFHKHCQAMESLLIFLHSLQPPLMMFKWKSKNTYNLFFLCDDCVFASVCERKI
jgi:hypothetical protein